MGADCSQLCLCQHQLLLPCIVGPLVSSDVPELLSQKAGQVHIDVEKKNFEVCVKLYIYGLLHKGLWVLA